VKETKDDELLLTTEEEDEIKQVTNNAAHILEDLTDLQFEQQQEIKKEQEEIEVINREIDEAASKQIKCRLFKFLINIKFRSTLFAIVIDGKR